MESLYRKKYDSIYLSGKNIIKINDNYVTLYIEDDIIKSVINSVNMINPDEYSYYIHSLIMFEVETSEVMKKVYDILKSNPEESFYIIQTNSNISTIVLEEIFRQLIEGKDINDIYDYKGNN